MNLSPEMAIRLRRAAFNKALADADLAAIGPLLARNVLLVTGTDSAVVSGQKAQLLAWKREFAAPNRTIYVRSTKTVTLSPIEPIAFEEGIWHGGSADEAPIASGIYTAKWRLTGANWLIEAELYLTLA